MILSSNMRKLSLTAHITFSVGWIGAVITYLILDITTLTNQGDLTLRTAYLAMELITWWAIVPLALASLLTCLVMSISTTWGLFRHYWVLFKLLLTILATVVLLNYTQVISYKASIAADPTRTIIDLQALGSSLLHSIGGLFVLLVIMILSVYKPQGITPYGWRKQQERRRV